MSLDHGHNEIAHKVVGLSLAIHRTLGPGLFESVYEAILFQELKSSGLMVLRQYPVPLSWKGVDLGHGFRADLIIENKVIVEIKSVEAIAPVHKKQLLTYLKLTNIKLGLLINFNEELLKDGLSRIINGYI